MTERELYREPLQDEMNENERKTNGSTGNKGNQN